MLRIALMAVLLTGVLSACSSSYSHRGSSSSSEPQVIIQREECGARCQYERQESRREYQRELERLRRERAEQRWRDQNGWYDRWGDWHPYPDHRDWDYRWGGNQGMSPWEQLKRCRVQDHCNARKLERRLRREGLIH